MSKKEFKRILAFLDSYAFRYNGVRYYAINKREPAARTYFMVLGEPGLYSCLLRDSNDPIPETVAIDERLEDAKAKATFNEDDFQWVTYSFLKNLRSEHAIEP